MSSAVVDPVQLQESMLNYAKEEWKKTFHFEYEGSQSAPPNKVPGGKVVAYSNLALFKSYGSDRPTENYVQDWVSAELFRRDDRVFPHFVMSKVYDDIVQHIVRYTNSSDNHFTIGPVKVEDNPWNPELIHSLYPITPENGLKTNFQHYACYLYGGTVVENAIDDSGNEQKLLVQYVSYLSVFSAYK